MRNGISLLALTRAIPASVDAFIAELPPLTW